MVIKNNQEIFSNSIKRKMEKKKKEWDKEQTERIAKCKLQMEQ